MQSLLRAFARCLPLVIGCAAALPICAQEETPFTRLFDTGAASAVAVADEAVAKRTGWTLVPEDTVAHQFSGDAVLLNDKLAVVLRKQGRGAEVYSKTASGLKVRTSVGHVGASSALKIVENTSSAVTVQAMAPDKATAALSFRLTTGEAILEIRSAEGAESVSLQCQARYVVVPDYFGDDVVIATAALPHLGGRSYTTPTSPGESGARVTRPSEMLVEPVPEGWMRGSFLPAENFCWDCFEKTDSKIGSFG